jgi:hypothetical protein
MVYLGGFGAYRERCAAIARQGYEGFVFNSRADEATSVQTV